MIYSPAIRRHLLRTLDRLKGAPVAQHLADIEKTIHSTPDARREFDRRLQTLLSHATLTSPFYRDYHPAVSLSDFPVIQKRTISRNYDAFLSSSYDRRSLLPRKTSGSYGTPLTFWVTPEKMARVSAELIFFSGSAGFKVGMRHAHTIVRRKPLLTRFAQNEMTINPTYLSTEHLQAHRQILLKPGVHFLIGYPSVIASIAETCASHGDSPGSFCLRGIICTAEPLHEDVKCRIEQVFGCEVLSRYATLELGVLAQQTPGQRSFVANSASFHIQLLAFDRDATVADNELGRIVVTDLFSHAMPLIRYDTGDLGIVSRKNGALTFERIEGRETETIRATSGVRVSPISITSVTKSKMEGVVQYEFIQKSAKAYCMRRLILPSFSGSRDLEGCLKDLLGDDAEIAVDYPAAIPPLPSGKRPYILSELNHVETERPT